MHLGLRALPPPSGSSRQEAAIWVSVHKAFPQLHRHDSGIQDLCKHTGTPVIADQHSPPLSKQPAACGCPRSLCWLRSPCQLSWGRKGNATAISATLMHNLPFSFQSSLYILWLWVLLMEPVQAFSVSPAGQY